MTDQDVRSLLERMAAEEPIPFFDVEPLTRRARRRAARTVALGALVAAAAIGVLFAGVAEIRTAPLLVDQPTPTVTSPPTPFPERFDSTLNGLSIGYPSGWQVRPATEPWDRDAFTFDAPGADVIFDPSLRDDLYISVASWPLDGQSEEDWLWAGSQVCERGGNFGRFTVDGAQASYRGCDGVANRFEDMVVQVATATHGYVIYLHVADDPFLHATYTEAWFDAVLETVELP
jgi:hypothetical protein